MLPILLQFTDCIESFEILVQETRSDLTKTKFRVSLINSSVIFWVKLLFKMFYLTILIIGKARTTL